jgi:hypothetical protein
VVGFKPKGERNGVELFFDFKDSRAALEQSVNVHHGVADFVYFSNSDITAISIATPNKWHRDIQLPHRKQLEGIIRRASIVLDVPPESMRIRNLLLPPAYMDRASLQRINRHVLGMDDSQASAFAPWLPLYRKELDATAIDYIETSKKFPEEEWVKL